MGLLKCKCDHETQDELYELKLNENRAMIENIFHTVQSIKNVIEKITDYRFCRACDKCERKSTILNCTGYKCSFNGKEPIL